MPGTRTFLALPLPAPVRAALAELRTALPPPPRGLRGATLSQPHLTLVFLGDLEDDALADVRARARGVAAGTATFEADLAGVGAFPSPARARVAWVGWGGGAAAVTALHAELVAALDRPRDPRPFTPHVTLARARDPVDARAWLAAAPDAWRSPAWRVDGLDVVSSELRREGAVHEVLERCPFGAPGAARAR
ncbi:MAG: RNA 2',3'-cyclic phosphodiesterase [Trueperaceae bacterium]|nr:RNA 2',3'-cyclic phosphodiesterase [Trueperaceae bacterium]